MPGSRIVGRFTLKRPLPCCLRDATCKAIIGTGSGYVGELCEKTVPSVVGAFRTGNALTRKPLKEGSARRSDFGCQNNYPAKADRHRGKSYYRLLTASQYCLTCR